ncbi:MAG: arylsulfatase [Acidobacteriia bacterium]|nr:arylsulfatase [Terriglobia bacterium]
MNRRAFLQSGPALAGASALLEAGGEQERPNILLLMADQHRADCVGAAGNAAIHTPNLDRLARGGVMFRHAYSSTPTCTPARAALLTGMSPWNYGMLGYGAVAERYSVEMPRLLRDAGYYTAGIGKMHWRPQRALHGFHMTLLDESGRVESGDFRSDYRAWFWSERPDGDPDASGMDWNGYDAKPYPLPERLHPTAWIGETAVRFLRDYERPEPFFLKVSFERPHSPYDPPKRWMARYSGSLPPAQVGSWADKYRPRNSGRPDIWHGDPGQGIMARARQGYYGSVSFVDEQIGRILDALNGRGWLNRTLVLYLADHGDMLGDHYLWRKSYAYEGSARIPMLLHWPSGLGAANRGSAIANPVEIRDVLPTLLDAAGIVAPKGVDGVSLLQLVRNSASGWREWIDLEHDVCYSPENHWNALPDGKWKYIFHSLNGQEQLFNLEADPHERHDLAGDSAQSSELRMWRERLITHLSPRGDAWVAGGRLQLRAGSRLYSPNYPSGRG